MGGRYPLHPFRGCYTSIKYNVSKFSPSQFNLKILSPYFHLSTKNKIKCLQLFVNT